MNTPTVYEIAGNCPLRKILSAREVPGVPQFLSLKNQILHQYILDRLTKDDPTSWDPIGEPRVLREIAEKQLDTRIAQFRKEFAGVILEAKTPIMDTLGGSIQLHYWIGRFNDEPAIFLVNLSSGERDEVSREQKYALLLAAENEYGPAATIPEDVHLIILLPIAKEPGVQELLRYGKVTAKGVPDKRDKLGKWTDIHDVVWTMIAQYWDELKIPTYQPVFGSCLTCPFHNVNLSVDGRDFQCVG
jgi:hypothetical protein